MMPTDPADKDWQELPTDPPIVLRWFKSDHLKDGPVRDMSKRFQSLALQVELLSIPGPERSTALRKLLEAKDAAVRSVVHPGG